MMDIESLDRETKIFVLLGLQLTDWLQEQGYDVGKLSPDEITEILNKIKT